MRSKTIKRLAILIAGLGLIGGTGLVAQRVQITRLAHDVVEQADRAKKAGDFVKAELLLKGHIQNVPDDLDVRLKYADLITENAKSPARQEEAMGIYTGILTKTPGNLEVHRRVMDLAFATGRYARAQGELVILLGSSPLENKDGDLQFLMARCFEELKDDVNADKYYQAAIEHKAGRVIEAYKRRAILLRKRPDQVEDADAVIQTMVESDPKNFQVYLERGRYRLVSGLPGAEDDFQTALKFAPDKEKIGIYLEIAQVAEKQHGPDAARKILETELKNAPDSLEIREALIMVELRSNQFDKGIELLRSGIEAFPTHSQFRWILARVLAQRGDNQGLMVQIDELKRSGFPSSLVRLLTANYNINKGEYAVAQQILTQLQNETQLRAMIDPLLARCYGYLDDPEKQREVYLEILKNNPGDLSARLGWIAILVKQGETDRAIEEYERLVGKVPQVRLPLARLLIVRNLQRPAGNRDWSKVDSLIGQAAAEAPESVEPKILQAESLRVQGKTAEAGDALEKALLKDPKRVEIWAARVSFLKIQGRVDEAQKVLDQARGQLGDRVELRLAQAQLLGSKKGPEAIATLNELAKGIDRFSKEDQNRLLIELATEYYRRDDLKTASRLWSEVAQRLSNNIDVRRYILDVAFKMDDEKLAEKTIKEIEKIEGNDGLKAGYFRASYLVMQAQRALEKGRDAAKQTKEPKSDTDRVSDPKASEESLRRAQALQTEAHLQINQLMSRRGDWSLLHMLLAQLEEQELAQLVLEGKPTQEKRDRIINSYLRAIELGRRESNVVRHVVQLLFEVGRNNDAVDLYIRSTVDPQPGNDRVERMVSREAYKKGDLRRAEEVTRRALVANPGDHEERLWLARILLAGGRQPDAETELRRGIDLFKNDPLPRINLLKLLADTKQPEKAEKAFEEAQPVLAQSPEPTASLALAECSELVGRAYEGGKNADAVKRWYGKARSSVEKAQAAKPDDLSIARSLTQFLFRTRQVDEAESQLAAMLKRADKNSEEFAWARRTLALSLIEKGDPVHARQALALYEPTDQTPKAAEDQRVLARVLDAQRTPDHRKRAIEIMNSLVEKEPDNSEDRILLGQFDELAGDWSKAREQYDELIKRTENREDPEIFTRRVDQFVRTLIRHSQASDGQELSQAQDLVDKLKRIQPDDVRPLVLEVMINRVRSQFENAAAKKATSQADKEAALQRAKDYVDKASGLVVAFAERPNLTPTMLAALATQAEGLNELEMAEKLQRQIAAKMSTPRGMLGLAAFLGRHGKVKEALDLYAPLFSPDLREPDLCFLLCTEIIRTNSTIESADLKRMSDWLDVALKLYPQSTPLMVGLANLHERQGRYQDAEALYRRAIAQGDRDGVSHNNLAWLMALKVGGDAKELKDALDHVNRAIDLKGPRPDFLDTRGIVYLARGEIQAAISDLEKAVAGAPSASKYFHLAEAYLKANKVAEAKKNWEAAKITSWEQSGLHALEQPAFKAVRDKLEKP
jgi:cellulose synthase operon protein C